MSRNRTETDRIAVTGMGLVTSLGFSAASSLAAIRSGLANFSRHETVLVDGNEHGTTLTGARIARVPEHAVRRTAHAADRAVALLAPALRQCIPDIPHRFLQNALWRIGTPLEPNTSKLCELLKTAVLDLRLPPLRISGSAASSTGRCVLFEDISQATADLRKGTAPMVIVGCVDSLCDDETLRKLAEAGCLKSGTNPEGFVAGEAAGVFLLELESHAMKRNAGIFGYISAWGRGVEPHPWAGNVPSIALGLRSAFAEAFLLLPRKGEEIDMVVADLNGEAARGNEWAMTAGNIFSNDEKARELEHPADCTGDCGAAMGAVVLGTGIAVMSGARQPVNIALCTSDDAGARRVLCLERGSLPAAAATGHHEPQNDLPLVPSVIEQHHDEASFLWLMRQRMATARHFYFRDLERLDHRLAANLDGLYCAVEAGSEACKRSLAYGDAGDFFAAAFLAFKTGNKDRAAYLLDKASGDIDLCQGIISALAWLNYDDAEPIIDRFLTAQSPLHRYIGIAASAIHRRDPKHFLNDAACDSSPLLKARALRAYGELGRNAQADLATLQNYFSAEDDGIRFSASWSAALAGNMEAVEVLKTFVAKENSFREEAIEVALHRMDKTAALSWHQALAALPDTIRVAVLGAGIIGDPILVPWILEQMANSALARLAGEAFSTITGLDIAVAVLQGTRPARVDLGPNDDPRDHNVALDADQELPWPDSEQISSWWNKNKASYPHGVRHFVGKPISEDHLEHILKTGSQRNRAAAALDLVMIRPGRPLFDVRAPAFRQTVAK